jgi:cobalt-zinc-cadmium efflux system outer membrane protein
MWRQSGRRCIRRNEARARHARPDAPSELSDPVFWSDTFPCASLAPDGVMHRGPTRAVREGSSTPRVPLRRLVAVIVLVALPFLEVHAQALTEAQALGRMRANYPEFRALSLGVSEAAAESTERRLMANPTVSFTRETTSLGRDDFYLVSQELPVTGRRRLLGEANREVVRVAESQAAVSELAFERRLRVAFADLLHAQARGRVLETGVRELSRLVDVLRLREEAGEGSRFDRLRAEREVTDIEFDIESGSVDTFRRQARLASFLGDVSDPAGLRAEGAIGDMRVVPPLDELLTAARADRPDYRVLTRQAARWEAERQAARRLRFPAAAVTAGLKRSRASLLSDSGFAVTATMVLPVFNRGQAQVGRAEAARGRAEARRLTLEIHITNDVRAAYTAASRYRGMVTRYQTESVEPAAELVLIATTAYEEGAYGILELLDSHRVKLRAELRFLKLSAMARLAHVELDHAAGQRR